MEVNSLSWLSLKRLETNVALEEELDLMIRKPNPLNILNGRPREITSNIHSIKRSKAERTFVKRIITGIS